MPKQRILGTHSIGLSGVADNCQVQGANPRNVVVAAGSVAALAFSVKCAEAPALAGTLRITTRTTGPDQDEDGYTVAVDGGDGQPIGVTATTTLANIAAGDHTIEGRTLAGTALFSLSFEALEVADDPSGARHFAFAVPLDPIRAARLESLRLIAPGSPAAVRTRPAPQLRPGNAGDLISARRTAKGVTLQWNSAAHPMLLVRDHDTGEVLSFARGGEVEVVTTKAALDVTVSQQVVSSRSRVVVRP